MNALRSIFKDQLTETPKRKSQKQHEGFNSHLGWVFVTNDCSQTPISVRTYHSLFDATNSYTYYTPNTFYRNDKREKGSLRWLNCLIVDIDVKNGHNERLTLPDVHDRVTSAGLPRPSLIVSTPSKGFHVYWHLKKPKRAFEKVVGLYTRIQRAVAIAIGGDVQAIGAERYFRMPNSTNTLFKSDSRVTFDDLCFWFEINQEELEYERCQKGVDPSTLLAHPAIEKLLQGVSKGKRDNTCYTLALAFKAAGYDMYEAEERLKEWNELNTPMLTQLEVKRKVRSAYKPGAPAGPSALWIQHLSQMKFAYNVWEPAKDREQRKYSHLDEWQDDVIAFLKKRGGVVCGAQRTIAKEIRSSADDQKSIPYSTFKRIIEQLIRLGIVIKTVEGKGRAAVTTLTLVNNPKVVPFKQHKKNGLNSNTFIDRWGGGSLLGSSYGWFFLSVRFFPVLPLDTS